MKDKPMMMKGIMRTLFLLTSTLSGPLEAFTMRRRTVSLPLLKSTHTFSQDTLTRIPPHLEELWGIEPKLESFPGANFPLGEDQSTPPILELPNFLSASECQMIQDWAQQAIEDGAEECDDYLNYRVNQEVESKGESTEGRTLIEECVLSESDLSAIHRGGFRVRLDDAFVENMLKGRLLDLLGMQDRTFVFEDGPWIRPTPKTVVVRDKTVVFYGPGNGVPPHVDGKDATLLVYLSTGKSQQAYWQPSR